MKIMQQQPADGSVSWLQTVNIHKLMDFGRRSDIYQTDHDIPTKVLLDPADGQAHQPSEHGKKVKFCVGTWWNLTHNLFYR